MKTRMIKKMVIASLFIFQTTLSSLFAQNDSIYIYRLGQVDYTCELKKVDSISFFIDASLPIVTTTIPTNIDYTKVSAGGNVTSDGGINVSERGVCWSLNPIPTIKNNKVFIGSGTGSFNAEISGLSPNTTYYLRAFASNRVGVSYGEEVHIKTLWDGICGGFVGPDRWKEFMCRNLGADPTVDPFTPSWQLNGDYYQWGKKVKAANAPTGPGINETNENVVVGWNTSYVPDNLWLDAVKTENDPCPQGFRVPKISN